MNRYSIALLLIILYLVSPALCKQNSDDDIPPELGAIGGSRGRPPVDLIINISVKDNKTDFKRGEIISVIYEISGDKKSGVDVVHGLIRIPRELENIRFTGERFVYDDVTRELRFNKYLKKNEIEICSYDADISLISEPGELDLGKSRIGEWRWDMRGDLVINDETKIIINNNIPIIKYATLMVPESDAVSFMPCNNMLIYKNIGSPLILYYDVDASDVENEPLYCYWSIKQVRDQEIENSTVNNTAISIIPIKKSLSEDIPEIILSDVNPGMKYYFNLSIKDLRDETGEINVSIKYGNGFYDSIYIPKADPIIPIVIYILVIIVLLLIGYFREKIYIYYNVMNGILKQKGVNYADKVIVMLILILITLTYILLNLYLPEMPSIQESYRIIVYLKSLSLFHIYIYLMVFVVVVYFTEVCFGKEESSRRLVTVSKLWFINSVLMLVLLLSIDAIIPQANELNSQDWLSNYYGEMGEIFATILAIIAAFYTAIPKNIISLRRSGTGQEEKKYQYLHTKMLHYFLGLYSVIVVLSIWGFSVGLTAKFPALVDLNRENLFNLISIGVFETTLLLVPPAMICLFELLRSMLFTGNVKLASKPSGAEIWINGSFTHQMTPNMLMLPKGAHIISLRKEGYQECDLKGIGEGGKVCVYAGTEQEYECELIKKNGYSVED